MADEQQATEVSETAEAFSDESVDTDVVGVEETAAPEQAGGSQASEEPSGFADVNEESAETTDEASEQDSSPEEYSAFDLPDGVDLGGDRLDAFSSWAKSAELSQGQAQSAVDLYIKLAQQDHAKAEADWKNLAAEWTANSKSAGHLSNTAMAEARAGLRSVDPDGSLGRVLEQAALDRHPAMLAVFRAYGRSVSSPADVPTAQTMGSPRVVDHAERLYPQQQKT